MKITRLRRNQECSLGRNPKLPSDVRASKLWCGPSPATSVGLFRSAGFILTSHVLYPIEYNPKATKPLVNNRHKAEDLLGVQSELDFRRGTHHRAHHFKIRRGDIFPLPSPILMFMEER